MLRSIGRNYEEESLLFSVNKSEAMVLKMFT